MKSDGVHAVTGAFGYSGKYIAQRLLDGGARVITLTNSVHRENPFGERVRVLPLCSKGATMACGIWRRGVESSGGGRYDG